MTEVKETPIAANRNAFVYRGWQFYCSAERDRLGGFRGVVAYCMRWPVDDLRVLPHEGPVSRDEAGALHAAEERARLWAEAHPRESP